MTNQPIGPLIHSFFVDHLVTVKGLRPASIRSYRDTIRLLLCYLARDTKITKLTVGDLTFERVVGFLRHLEDERHNHTRTRNQRLAALHVLFDYIATREPEMLAVCQQVAAIPAKRAAPPETRFLERDEIQALFRDLPRDGRLALRDRTLLRSSTTPEPGCKKPPTCGSATSNLVTRPSFASTARATNGEPAPSGTRQSTCYKS